MQIITNRQPILLPIVKVREQVAQGEVFELVTVTVDIGGAPNFFFEDYNKNRLKFHLPGFNDVPAQSICVGGQYSLNGRMVIVVEFQK